MIPASLSVGQRPKSLALTLYKPFGTSLQRCATNPRSPLDKIDRKHEEAVEHEAIEVHPEEVSASSSVHQIFHEKGTEEPEKDEDMLAGVKSDFVSSKFLSKPSHLLTLLHRTQ